ncbi:16S rRNA (adenine(1518)-N(6)/adenine(1519)-N(6))-dimethyltransferase RsmA [Porticoccus litoralis]|uniref:Ribosomal RNA small subunit methyltransferase A n=1 Tax=Porticoccus litoralis TaxID=434086 RepID=A0AAW8B380_9GAMM|nr:16S rRNA (adenine(1518)-N(6)/adenine(1519)-N(6))-dimethyltransferase RsmA [Porticoccus litoralis]MDP1520194.1 16S rRNA (adenine(1518)-N(6)/adenine(1519)-N(6))-dimethyltransferase RsmA [Porticoccus litoralis]
MSERAHSGHQARKRFGQNFLVDANIIANIVAAIAPKPTDNLIEIGPGQGAITEPVLSRCPTLKVVELDRDLIPLLKAKFQQHPSLQIHQGDALKTDFSQFYEADRPLRIIGNLPYNISTPLLFHLLSYSDKIYDMHFMLQKEVVDRLAAAPGDSHYGRLSVMVQYHSQVQPLFPVPPGAFRPAPKVDSAIVRLLPYSQPPHPAKNLAKLAHLVNACFQQRRKTIRNTLKHLVNAEQLATLNIDLSLRPEKLSVADFVQLSNQLTEMT